MSNITQKTKVFGGSVPADQKTVDAAVTLKSGENYVRCEKGAAPYDVTLPSIADCAGETFVLHLVEGTALAPANVGVVLGEGSVADLDVGDCTPNMTVAGDHYIIRNVNGVCWELVDEVTTAPGI